MNKAQAAFEILYMLSLIDGNVDDGEVQVICSTVSEKYHTPALDPAAILDDLGQLSEMDRIQRFHTAATDFAQDSDPEEQGQLFAKAKELVSADGELTAEERVLVDYLKSSWQIRSVLL